MNIMLTIVEILFYFHPAVWWISANVKAERENCCDDYALSHNVDKMVYAKALVKLEESKSSGIPSLAMPFAENKHQLLNRIKRIMNMPQNQNDIKEKSLATVLLLSIVLLFSNQANSETLSPEEMNNEFTEISDSTKLKGEEEMVLTVKEGKFESLSIDNEIQMDELVDKIAATVNKNSTDNRSYTMTVKESPELMIIDDKVQIVGQGGVIYESDDDYFVPTFKLDTLPENSWKGKVSIITEKDGKVIEIEKENGKVKKLKIDGKEIPESEYDNYLEEIDLADGVQMFDGDINIFKDFDGDDFSKSFGLLFDGEKWREFGGNMSQFFDNDVFEKMKEMDGNNFNFKYFDNMDEFRNGEGMAKLQEMLEDMGIQMDSTFKGMNFNFDFDGFDGFDGFDSFDGNEFFYNLGDDDVMILRDKDSNYKRGTVVDKMGNMLNKDGLLEPYKSNKIEITGKHLKINGEKMPKAIYQKYKDIYQESTGAPLSKGSKMTFNVEGKPSKRKVKTF